MPRSVAAEEPWSRAHQRRRRRGGRSPLCHRDRARTTSLTCRPPIVEDNGILAELSATIAHEVNQPLAAIVMRAETGLRWLLRDQPSIAKREPALTPIDLSEVVEEALLSICHEVESKSVTLSVTPGLGLPLVSGDRIQLQQVIVNLLVNSIHAVAQVESLKRRIDLETCADEDDAVSFLICDSGPGIAAENLDHVFESFFTTKEGGMGIGLAICQSLRVTDGTALTGKENPP